MARNAKQPFGWSQYELARKLATEGALGRSAHAWRASIANYESRGNVPREPARYIAQALGIDFGWLFDESRGLPVMWGPGNAETVIMESRPLLNLVPFWGAVPCGDWERPSIEDEQMIQVSDALDDIRGVVAVRVAGNSMAPRLQHGDLIAVRLSSPPLDGIITLARNLDGELTLKLMRHVKGEWELHSINPDYGQAKAAGWEILGHAIHREETDRNGLRG